MYPRAISIEGMYVCVYDIYIKGSWLIFAHFRPLSIFNECVEAQTGSGESSQF